MGESSLAAQHELEVCRAADTGSGSFSLDYRVLLKASPERVFQALTEEVHHWWPHTYRDNPRSIVLEPQVGGRFMELWDSQGRGVLLGQVEIFDPPTTLRVRGAIGMNLAVDVVYTITLSEQDGGTLLHEAARVSGETSERLREGMRKGTETEYGEHLRAWVEQGIALR